MQVEINEKLLQTIRQLAEELGRSEEEVVETAVLFYITVSQNALWLSPARLRHKSRDPKGVCW